jgi:hypothetical protein
MVRIPTESLRNGVLAARLALIRCLMCATRGIRGSPIIFRHACVLEWRHHPGTMPIQPHDFELLSLHRQLGLEEPVKTGVLTKKKSRQWSKLQSAVGAGRSSVKIPDPMPRYIAPAVENFARFSRMF